MKGAKSPIVLAGRGAARNEASDALVLISERLGIPAATTFMGNGVFPDDHADALGALGFMRYDYANLGFDRADWSLRATAAVLFHGVEFLRRRCADYRRMGQIAAQFAAPLEAHAAAGMRPENAMLSAVERRRYDLLVMGVTARGTAAVLRSQGGTYTD